MFLSLGNMVSTANIGMLLIDFELPRRLGVLGTTEILPKDALSDHSPGARHWIRVTVSQLFVNCGRYIHAIQGRTLSAHVPDEFVRQPYPAWKRIEWRGRPIRARWWIRGRAGIWAASVVRRCRRQGHKAFAEAVGARSISTVAVRPATNRTPCGT